MNLQPKIDTQKRTEERIVKYREGHAIISCTYTIISPQRVLVLMYGKLVLFDQFMLFLKYS